MKIKLSNTEDRFLIDDEDYDKIKYYKWSFNHNGIHARVEGPRKNVTNCIMGDAPPGKMWDHIDRNPLNNQKNNLRLATKQQNNQNKSKQKNTSSTYIGVSWFSNLKKWRAQIRINGKATHLGYYETEIMAAERYNRAAKKYFGEFANLNTILQVQSESSNVIHSEITESH